MDILDSGYNREYRCNSEILAASIREECLDTDIMLKALQYD